MNILYCDKSITKSWHCSGRTTILQSFELPQKFHKIMTMKKYLVKNTTYEGSVKVLSYHKDVTKSWQYHDIQYKICNLLRICIKFWVATNMSQKHDNVIGIGIILLNNAKKFFWCEGLPFIQPNIKQILSNIFPF